MPGFLLDRPSWFIAGVVLAFFGVLTVGNVAIGFVLERLFAGRRIFDIPLAKGQLRIEVLGNCVFILITTAAFTTALSTGLVHFDTSGATARTLVTGALTFFALMIGFQVFYYFLHRGMHHRLLLRFHRWHHRSQVTTPLSAQSVSPVEALFWMIGYVALPAALSWITPISFWGYVAYIAFNVSGNIVGHANIEPTPRASASRAATWFSNPFVYHALHHARWTNHYCFQAAWMDRLFGTEYPDWPKVYDRVTSGAPLKSFNERG